MISGLLRVRNEELILEDTLKHYLQFVERVYAYDDASTDRTAEILQSFDRVTTVLGYEHGPQNESVHRELLRLKIKTPYTLVFDADERLDGEFPKLEHDGYLFHLYDAYMTPEHQVPYLSGPLAELPRLYGPERRDIMMLFRTDAFRYIGRLQRVPSGRGTVVSSNMNVKHFGKALSVEHWEETCNYYSTWPEPYGSKWSARRGKAIHKESDFGRPIYPWPDVVQHSVLLDQ
jgi:glycosyltransferase involved in cell wall biosynthesis